MLIQRKSEVGFERAAYLLGVAHALYAEGFYLYGARIFNLPVRGNFLFLIPIIIFFIIGYFFSKYYYIKSNRCRGIVVYYEGKKNVGFIGAIFFLGSIVFYLLWNYTRQTFSS